MKLTFKHSSDCFSSLPFIHFGHWKLCTGIKLTRNIFLILPRCPDWIWMNSIFFTLGNDRIWHCLQGLSGRNRKVSCKAFFYTEMSSVRMLGEKMKWVRFKYFLNAKLHSSARPRMERFMHIHRKLLKDYFKTFHKVRDPRPFDDLLMQLGSATVYIFRSDGHCCSWMSQVLEPEKGCSFSLVIISYWGTPRKSIPTCWSRYFAEEILSAGVFLALRDVYSFG